MKKVHLIFISLVVLLTACLSAEAKKELIDGKATYAVYERVQSLIGTEPIGFDTEDTNVEWENYDQIQTLSDPWLKTLKPTHQISRFSEKHYLNLYYTNPYEKNENIHLFIPNTTARAAESHRNIILKGTDNGRVVYYVFEGGEKETAALIEWMNENAPK
ncbi:hypothetical protein P8610_06370 [Fictibacillus sp. UD]|uniref:hypothetical protein n=1 Tax=Fictibacillus sp. UD TaxID=3038777 RepID=UPI003745B0EA